MSMRMVGWPSSGGTATSVMPGTVSSTRRISSATLAPVLQVGAADLDGVFGFDAGGGLLNVVLDVLREVEFDAGELLAPALA